MDPARYAKVRDLFFAVDDLPSGEVAAFLANHCDGDQALAAEVMALLRQHDSAAAAIEGQRVGANPNDILESKTVRQNAGGSAESSAHATIPGAIRTHAVARYSDEPQPGGGQRAIDPIRNVLLAAQTRRRTRNTGLWLYLLFLLPTIAVGLYTYRAIQRQLRQSVANELRGVADGLAQTVDGFLGDKARLVESWTREPTLRAAVAELVSAANDIEEPRELRNHPAIDLIENQLRELSGNEAVKFVLWNESLITVASWLDDRGDVGMPINPDGAAELMRTMSGRTTLFGPAVLSLDIPGFTPETDQPVLGVLCPVRNDAGRPIAVLMIRGMDWFNDLARVFERSYFATGLDVYAVNRSGFMLTPSVVAKSMAAAGELDFSADRFTTRMRVVDPGTNRLTTDDPVQRDIRPITLTVADYARDRVVVRTLPYTNYANRSVVGTSRGLPQWSMGIIVEQVAERAFAPVRLVRNSYIGLALLFAVGSLFFARRIGRQGTAVSAAAHPLARYEMLGELGSGGMGTVYHAKHQDLGRDTAVKVLAGSTLRDEDRRRFDREARLAASLANPHTVTIYDYGHAPEGNSYCVMEFLRGLTLAQVVARSGPQPIGRVLAILRQVCDALVEAHDKGLCHRDVKPHNIMLSLDRTVGDWAVVFDFGLAKPLSVAADVFETTETVWSGTPMYMAPERFRTPTDLDPRSDIYSVGAVAYFLITGRPPFLESDPETLFSLILNEDPVSLSLDRNEPVPEEIESLVFRMMAKQLSQRTSSLLSVSATIDELRIKYPWSIEQARVWWNLHGDLAVN